jgi:hypothetical protein
MICSFSRDKVKHVNRSKEFEREKKITDRRNTLAEPNTETAKAVYVLKTTRFMLLDKRVNTDLCY